MKTNNLMSRLGIIAVWLFVALGCYAAEQNTKSAAVPPAPVAEAPKPDPVAALTKERDDLKTQTQNLQVANQYLSVLAERNEMAVRLLQANQRADELQKQLDAEKAKTAELQGRIDKALEEIRAYEKTKK